MQKAFNSRPEENILDGEFLILALVEGVNFFAGETPVAAGAEASFLIDTLTNSLFYDADGSGDGAAVLIADLQDLATVSVDDFAFF